MKVHIETYGCSANQNNSEIMAGLLDQAKIKIVENLEEADLIVLNTCIVKGPTEAKEITRIKDILKQNKLLVVAGCMPETSEKRIKEISTKIAILGVNNITEIVNVVKSLEKNDAKTLLTRRHEIKLNLPKISKNPAIDIIQIAEGCLGNCTYCSVKFAKGELHSFPIKDIAADVKRSVDAGTKEVWLTSQDNSAYGKDLGKDLLHLLQEIVKIKGDFKIRIGMMNPNHILPILDELVELYKNDKLFKFIHIPLQAGSDEVLKKMNRKYTIAEFKKIISAFRKEIPNITIATDIICGFPEETPAQFDDSLRLIEELRLDVVNISKFWLKKGTPASRLKQVSSQDIKERSKKMTALFNKISQEKYEEMIGWQGIVLVDEKNDKSFIARDDSYKPIVLKGKFNLGEKIKVKIIKSEKHYLIGELI